jgi:hypothetical protein
MSSTTYFKFPTEEAWTEAALTLGVAATGPVLVTEATYDEETGEELTPAEYEDQLTWSYYTHDHSCDVVGVIYNDDGVYDQETFEVVTPPTAMEGFHVNYIGAYPEELQEFVVAPSTPYRKFAGH